MEVFRSVTLDNLVVSFPNSGRSFGNVITFAGTREDNEWNVTYLGANYRINEADVSGGKENAIVLSIGDGFPKWVFEIGATQISPNYIWQITPRYYETNEPIVKTGAIVTTESLPTFRFGVTRSGEIKKLVMCIFSSLTSNEVVWTFETPVGDDTLLFNQLLTYDESEVERSFYLNSPVPPYSFERNESVVLDFAISDGIQVTTGVPFAYDNSQPDATGTVNWRIDGNTLTITNECWYSIAFIRFRSTEYPELEYEFEFRVTNPVQPPNPYTPGSDIGGGSGLPTGSGGGGGTFPSEPGPSLVDQIPTGQTGNDIANSGLFTMYLMNQQYMNLMGEILWEDNIGIQAAKEIFGNPINTIISTISYPFNLLNLVQYAPQNLYFGQWNTDLPFQAVTKSSFQIDWGAISIPFAWGNFLDYSPHTKMELFLPWGPGYVTIDPNDVSPFSNSPGNFDVSTFAAGSIQVKTNVELGKGTCVHNVIGNNGRVIGSYSGIVGKQVPITALDTGGKALTTIAAVSAVVGGVVAGSLAAKGAMDSGRLTGTPMRDPMRPFESASYWDTGMISGRSSAQSLINTGHNMASRAINSTPITFPRAGTFSDGSSAMTVQTPFLIISRPVQSVPTQYGHYNGYPSNIYYPNFSNLSGYTEISEIHLDNVTATADELQELDAILKGGILL